MPRLPRIGSRKLIHQLLRFGFYEHRVTGSHVHLRHETKLHLHVVIPANREVLAPKTPKSILVQAEREVGDVT